ncbi:MAG: hypothetical protein ACLFPQ_02440 [Candidatus Woesearchaeota archaeon]
MYLVLDAEGVLYGWNPPNNNKIDLEYANSLFLKLCKKLDLGEISYEDYLSIYNKEKKKSFKIREFQDIILENIWLNYDLKKYCINNKIKVIIFSNNFGANFDYISEKLDFKS